MMTSIAAHSGVKGGLGETGRSSTSRRTSASKVSSKVVHPLVVTTFAPTCHELSTWAYLTHPRPSSPASASAATYSSSLPTLPNLVTAHGNVLRIYVVDPISSTLLLAATYEKLAGIIVSLHCIPSASGKKVKTFVSSNDDVVNNANEQIQSNGGATTLIRQEEYDGLLLGFAGHPRLSMVYPSLPNSTVQENEQNASSDFNGVIWNGILTASSIIDLTPILLDHSWGSVAPLEQDLFCDVLVTQNTTTPNKDNVANVTIQDTQPTVGVILGGGIGVALFQLSRSNYSHDTTSKRKGDATTTTSSSWWWRIATEPYCLPLTLLAQSIPTSFNPHAKSSLLGIPSTSGSVNDNNYNYKSKYSSSGISQSTNGASGSNASSFSHGFGDIISLTFLQGYTEPVVVLLHSDPNRNGGQAWSGRLAHTTSYNTRYTLTLTAISVSTNQQRSVILWSLKDVMPSDAWKVVSNPISPVGRAGGGVIVLGVNELLYVDRSGRIRCSLAVNGWVRSTGSSALLQSRKQVTLPGGSSGAMGGGIMQPNPSPLSKLSIQLDGCCLSFVSDHVAILSLRDGTLYSMELHYLDKNGLGIPPSITTHTATADTTTVKPSSSKITNTTKMCISLSPIGFKFGALGMISSLCAFPLMKITSSSIPNESMSSFKSPFENVLHAMDDDESTSISKKEDNLDNDSTNIILKKEGESSASLGLIFAGSRLGDSTLLLYGLKEDVRLVPLGQQDNNDSYTHSKKALTKMDIDEGLKPSTTTSNDSQKYGMKRKRSMSDDGLNTKSKKQDDIQKEDIDDGEPSKSTIENGPQILTVTDDEMQSLTEEEILQCEEEALYAPIPTSNIDSMTTIRDDIVSSTIAADSEEEIYLTSGRQNTRTLIPGLSLKQLYRPQIQSISIFKSITAIDSLTGLGPIGPGCVGPTASTLPDDQSNGDAHLLTGSGMNIPVGASSINIHPCGYGSSGGLAVYYMPGLNFNGSNGSTIMNEVDCRNISGVYCCAQLGYVFLTKEEDSGCLLLQFDDTKNSTMEEESKGIASDEKKRALVEVDIDHWSNVEEDEGSTMTNLQNIKDVLTKTKILTIKEFSTEIHGIVTNFILLILSSGKSYSLNILAESDKQCLTVIHSHDIRSYDDDGVSKANYLVSTAISESLDQTSLSPQEYILSVACVWSNGNGSILNITRKRDIWRVHEVVLGGDSNAQEDWADDEENLEQFYNSNKIVAMDLFEIADDIFQPQGSKGRDNDKSVDFSQDIEPSPIQNENNYDFDEDDLELYGDDDVHGVTVPDLKKESTSKNLSQSYNSAEMIPTRYNTLGGYISGANLSDKSKVVVAVCRQSGELQVLDVMSLLNDSDDQEVTNTVGDPLMASYEDTKKSALWQSVYGCGQGVSILQSTSKKFQNPRYHNVSVSEIKVFFAGPSNMLEIGEERTKDLSILRSLCLLVETSHGDLHLYSGSKSITNDEVTFRRVSLGTVARPSEEEKRHKNKLVRKGIAADVTEESNLFHRPQRFHRFFSISGQDGVFAATSRPIWIVSERGVPMALSHRVRHGAPAGGRPLPLTGFCTDFKPHNNSTCFLTLHERIGRVGSQRLTLFSGLSDVFSPHGILPGGGVCIQKVPLGVTVRKVIFIDDVSISSTSHPIYVLLVSREIESDQSHLNDDGLTPEERATEKDAKEKEKLRRQVEADLGGFDVEQEWVEEIEREDCFEIDKRYGGAPTISSRVYEIWLIDASDWNICDTYQFEDFEHAIDMKLMTLSELDVEDSSTATVDDNIPEESLFLVVGVGNIDKDGEDVSSKGRILLFELNGSNDTTRKPEINFLYDKDMSLGPVTSLACLSCENKKRLVVGAGAEITLEQWGNGKLTQVGFFHARMYVQEIILFKNFMLISDAYDSLNLLVWRESDKSLTLLAKDYEPTSVYAAGLLSRGGSVSFVCHDDRQNLLFFSYAPNDVAARGGNKLVCKADFHLGTQTVGLQSHLCRSSLLINSATIQSTLVALKQQDSFHGRLDDDQRFALHFGTTDGGLSYIIPLNDNVYWRLAALQSVMTNALESDCALSGRSWRLYRRTTRRGGCKSNDRKKGVIDGDLTMKYVDLPLLEQENLASSIGSTVGVILDNLLEINCSSYVT